MPDRVARNRYYRVSLQDFSGGLNLRDSASELAANESPDCMNVTLDERGGIVKRLGLTKNNVSQVNSSAFSNIFYSPTLQILIAQQGNRLFKSTDAGSSWSELQNNGATTPAFTDSGRVFFVEFLGKICVLTNGNTDKGIYTYDNTTAKISAKVTNSPPCNMGAVWQNRLFTAGDTANPTTVTNTDAGALTYTTLGTTYNTLPFRTKDDAPVTAIGGGEGIDFAGRSGLLVFKDESTYRINNSSTLAYDVISIAYGCSSPLALASLGGLTAALSKNGIIAVNDTSSGPSVTMISTRLDPLFRPTQLDYTYLTNACAGVYRDRLLFSITQVGSTTNNMTLEYHPGFGWIVPHDFGVGAYTVYGKQTARLFGCHRTAGYTYEIFKGGTDDGSTINARYQTRWVEAFGGDAMRLHRIRLLGRGAPTMYLKWDYTLGQGSVFPVNFAQPGTAIYNTSVYNGSDLYGPNVFEGILDFHNTQWGHAFSFQFTDSSTSSSTSPKLLLTGAADEVGSFAIYGIQNRTWPLEGL